MFAIAPTLFSADGDADGKVTVPNASTFKVKHRVKISGTALPQLDLEVKRVISDTEMFLGPQTGPISDREDISAYTTAAASFVFAIEQKRASIPFEEYMRAMYCEEPTVAMRASLVDVMGDKITSANPLPVDATLNIGDLMVDVQHPTAPTIVNHTIVTANTEFSLALPDDTKRFKLKVRDGKANLKMAFATGEIAASRFVKIRKGFWQEEGDMDLPDSFSIFLESDKSGEVIELLSWQL